jgi:hypothetical protein
MQGLLPKQVGKMDRPQPSQPKLALRKYQPIAPENADVSLMFSFLLPFHTRLLTINPGTRLSGKDDNFCALNTYSPIAWGRIGDFFLCPPGPAFDKILRENVVHDH